MSNYSRRKRFKLKCIVSCFMSIANDLIFFLYQNKATVRYKIKEFCNFAAL